MWPCCILIPIIGAVLVGIGNAVATDKSKPVRQQKPGPDPQPRPQPGKHAAQTEASKTEVGYSAQKEDNTAIAITDEPQGQSNIGIAVSGLPPAGFEVVSDAAYADFGGLPYGTALAQHEQRRMATQLGLPLEIRTSVCGIVLRLIPPGTFLMGSLEYEKERQADEGPQHCVTITRPFYMGKCPITQAQWQRVMGANPSASKGKNLPVDNVTWHDCQQFVEKLSVLERVPAGIFRLPTEAEWEYACRAGASTRFCRGDEDAKLRAAAWCRDNSGEKMHPVGEKEPNAFGLSDLHGNVWELCQDWYADYSAKTVENPTGPQDGTSIVKRGGSCADHAGSCRSASRSRQEPFATRRFSGLRLTALLQLTPSQESSINADLTSISIIEGREPREEPKENPPRARRSGICTVPNAGYASLSGLAQGSRAVQQRQREAVEKLGLPLEVKSKVVGIQFRLIPAGIFMMGSPTSEKDRDEDETQHRVTISRAFYMGKYQVTRAQWHRVMGTNPSQFKDVGENAPVECVSWNDCQKFMRKLDVREGLPEGSFRLPTEAEWEYACRAGTQTAFCYGDDLDSSMANFETDKITLVGSFKPNAWGLYDMHGNVEEWCQDWYGTYGTDYATDPCGPQTGSRRVVRGGSWNYDARFCRSANRYILNPDLAHNIIGFRFVLPTGQ